MHTVVFDYASLTGGFLRIQQLEAVMPDGLVVKLPAEGQGELTFDLTPLISELRAKPMRVLLAVPRQVSGAASEAGGTDIPRMRTTDGEDTIDLTSGLGGVQVGRQVPNLSLLVTRQPARKFVTMPIAEVACSDEAFKLTTYVPPHMIMPRTSLLAQECDKISRRVREKAAYLAERVRALREQGGREEADALRMTIAALVSGLPVFEALIASEAAHPFDVYLALCALMGHSTALTSTLLPPVLQPYDHLEIRRAFDELFKHVTTSLDSIQQNYTTHSFVEENGEFAIRVQPDRVAKHLIIGVRQRPGVSEEHTWQWLDAALIASRRRLDELRERRMLGAKRNRITREASMQLVPGGSMLLVAVRVDPEAIDLDDSIVITNTVARLADARPQELVLYVKTRQE